MDTDEEDPESQDNDAWLDDPKTQTQSQKRAGTDKQTPASSQRNSSNQQKEAGSHKHMTSPTLQNRLMDILSSVWEMEPWVHTDIIREISPDENAIRYPQRSRGRG